MKKFIRIAFPVFLVVAIILCSVWYLFIYDQDFTRDILLSCARHCEMRGNHTTAAKFYDLAYSQSGNNDAVAIELAEQYKASGNYTKAEFTLSNAIIDGGGIELYIALSKTYVEQDKLMDAVNMLNNITNPDIKEQLSSLRPKAPSVSPEPGFYSQYLVVSVTSDVDTLYVSRDGEYPSTVKHTYSDGIRLAGGENKISAVAVAPNGLVSPLATYGYIVGGVVEEVTFSDPAFEAALRGLLNFDADTTIHSDDLWNITEFTVPGEAATYADLKLLPYLKSLTIDTGISSELNYISSLPDLTTLQISNTTVEESVISIIAGLPKLRELSLENCGISSISPLANAKNLVTLNLSGNAIRNLNSLSSMKQLTELELQHNAISDLAPIAQLTTLTKLNVSYNAVTSLAPISGLTSLQHLDAGTNSITDLGDINNLSALTHLFLGSNSITDISKISLCAALTDLDISGNKISDISSLQTLVKLMYFNFSNNKVSKLPEFPKTSALVTVDGTSNQISNIDALAGLPALNNVYLDYNEGLSSIDKLAECPLLIKVNVYGTKVKNVDTLTAQSIIVNYNPVQ